MNQLATPGLGSWMAGRRAAGSGQLALAVVGFILVIAWLAELFLQTAAEVLEDTPPISHTWLGVTGVLVFLAAWLWALVTSLDLIRQAKTNTPCGPPPPLPPHASAPAANSGTTGSSDRGASGG